MEYVKWSLFHFRPFTIKSKVDKHPASLCFFFPPFNPLIKGEHSNCPMDNSYEEVLTKNVGQYFENYQYMT